MLINSPEVPAMKRGRSAELPFVVVPVTALSLDSCSESCQLLQMACLSAELLVSTTAFRSVA